MRRESRQRRSPTRSTGSKVPGPSGEGWAPSTINGNWRRGTGILNNELYIGRLVWNRQSFIKNPENGRRVARLNPASEWIVKDVPELRIVDQELWDRVKARQQGLRRNQAFHEKQRPRMLLSFLLKCGVCGGGFSKVSEKHYGCSTARNKGTCDNRLTVRQDELEGLVLAALQERLMDPALLEEFCAEYTAHLNRLRGAKNASLAAAKAELDKLTREKGTPDSGDQGRRPGIRGQGRSRPDRGAARRAGSADRGNNRRAGAAASEHGGALPDPGREPRAGPDMPRRTGRKPRTCSARSWTGSS